MPNRAADLSMTAPAAVGNQVVATLPGAAGAFHFISFVEIWQYATVALLGLAVPVIVTFGNIALAFPFRTVIALGDTARYVYNPHRPIRSQTLGDDTTITCPARAGAIWRVNVWYSVGPTPAPQ